jgi:hypothetical protein
MMVVDPIKTAELTAVEALKELRNMAASRGLRADVIWMNNCIEDVHATAKKIEVSISNQEQGE